MVLDCSKLRETLSVDAVREDCNTVMSDFEVSLPVHPPCPLPQCLLPLHPLPGWSLWAMNRSCIALQLWHHARPVRLRSPRRSPTGSGLTPGSCVLCLCYAGEIQMAKTSTSILVLKKKKANTDVSFPSRRLLLGCCLIPFFVKHFKDAHHSCPRCHRVLHIHRKTCCRWTRTSSNHQQINHQQNCKLTLAVKCITVSELVRIT